MFSKDLVVNVPHKSKIPAAKYGKTGQRNAVGPVGADPKGDANPCPEAMEAATEVASFM